MKVVKKHHNGIDFTMYQAEKPSRGEATLEDNKFHLSGIVSVTKAIGQYKYGDEVIIQAYNLSGNMETRKRISSKYDRIQVFFKLPIFKKICEKFLEELDE